MRVGVLGAGSVARANYLPALADIDDVELFLFNRTRSKAEEAAVQHGGTVCDDAGALVEAAADAIFVLTREHDRLEAVESLLEHGPARLMLEKPMSAKRGQANVAEEDFLDAREMVGQAGGIGTELAMIFNYRFFDHTMIAKEVIADRAFGEVLAVSGNVHYACWSHSIDLIQYFAGPVARVCALQGHREHEALGAAAVDIAAGFELKSGGTGTILGHQSSDFDFPLYDLSFGFEHGRISLRCLDDRMEIQDYRSGATEQHVIPASKSRWDQYRATFKRSIIAYLDTVKNGEPPPIPGLAGLQELQFEAALRRSAKEGRSVVIDEEFPLTAAGT